MTVRGQDLCFPTQSKKLFRPLSLTFWKTQWLNLCWEILKIGTFQSLNSPVFSIPGMQCDKVRVCQCQNQGKSSTAGDFVVLRTEWPGWMLTQRFGMQGWWLAGPQLVAWNLPIWQTGERVAIFQNAKKITPRRDWFYILTSRTSDRILSSEQTGLRRAMLKGEVGAQLQKLLLWVIYLLDIHRKPLTKGNMNYEFQSCAHPMQKSCMEE